MWLGKFKISWITDKKKNPENTSFLYFIQGKQKKCATYLSFCGNRSHMSFHMTPKSEEVYKKSQNLGASTFKAGVNQNFEKYYSL